MKKCQKEGCPKHSQRPSDFCKGHGGGKRCQQEGCPKSSASPSNFCVKHGGGKRCQEEGCTKGAVQPHNFCVKHGGGKRCQNEECSNGVQSRSIFCITHGGGKRCQTEECTKSAVLPTTFCIEHGGGKRCQKEGCTKSSRSPSIFCKGHGGGHRCTHVGCTKSSVYPSVFCILHGGGKRCQHVDCGRSARPTYDFCVFHGGGYRCSCCEICSVFKKGQECYTCRKGKGKIKSYEIMVDKYLNEHSEDVGFYSYNDTVLPCSPNRRRPDFVWVLKDRLVILEVDEHSHRFYNFECEIARITELMEQANTLPLILIRFNPEENLLPQLIDVLQNTFQKELDSLLHVVFLGYIAEYDVISEIEKISKRRTR